MLLGELGGVGVSAVSRRLLCGLGPGLLQCGPLGVYGAVHFSGIKHGQRVPSLDGLPRMHGYGHDQQPRRHCKRRATGIADGSRGTHIFGHIAGGRSLHRYACHGCPRCTAGQQGQHQQQCKKADDPPKPLALARVHPGKQFDKSSSFHGPGQNPLFQILLAESKNQYGGQQCKQASRHGQCQVAGSIGQIE